MRDCNRQGLRRDNDPCDNRTEKLRLTQQLLTNRCRQLSGTIQRWADNRWIAASQPNNARKSVLVAQQIGDRNQNDLLQPFRRQPPARLIPATGVHQPMRDIVAVPAAALHRVRECKTIAGLIEEKTCQQAFSSASRVRLSLTG